MPPTYRPPQRFGKQPPAVLPFRFELLIDLGDGTAWPRTLASLRDSGMMLPCGAFRSQECFNDRQVPDDEAVRSGSVADSDRMVRRQPRGFRNSPQSRPGTLAR